MRKFMISAAAMTVFALATAPANADFNFGPVKNGNLCWKLTPNSKEFGYWAACPQPAGVSAPTHRTGHHHSKAS
jgi:D-alanyl-D-alanine dipeptidase